MASARKCDRCGKLYEHYDRKVDGMDINGISLVESGEFCGSHTQKTKMYIDLCPECLTQLAEWLEGGENSDKTD